VREPSADCSIVIPAHQAEPFLAETLASALGQSAPPSAIIVVDDGSSDGTAAVAERFRERGVQLIRQAGSGPGAARNRGFAEVHSPRVVFLDADDRLCPDALERFGAALDQRPDALVVYGEVVTIDARGARRGTGGPPRFGSRPSGDVFRPMLEQPFIVSPGAACVRAEAVARLGGFRPDLTWEDWELWCRLALEGAFYYLGGPPVLERRIHDESISATLGTRAETSLRVIESVLDRPELAERFSPGDLARLRRRGEASVHARVGSECLKLRRWGDARRALGASLRLRPASPREWVLYAAAWARRLPEPLARRLK
jgi:glycosyltransferase involved in cell wall biosynthesis